MGENLHRALALFAALCGGIGAARAQGVYSNPLPVVLQDASAGENCADPTVIRGQAPGDTDWYMFCTQDRLSDADAISHLLPIFRSHDLVHWTHVGDVFASRPAWTEGGYLWAPDAAYFNGQYYLYYAGTDTRAEYGGEPGCGDDSAIGVATAPSPAGPWTDLGRPVVAPRRRDSGCAFHGTIDPEVITAPGGQRYIYYGSFGGGIEVRPLSPDGFFSGASHATKVAIGDHFEAALIIRREGWYYLLLSAAGCCSGPLSGYIVLAGRSASPTGPFVDRAGVPLDQSQAGGTPVLSMNGNRWIGPGHATHVVDFAGQDWLLYHAIDADQPYFAGSVGYTKRHPMLDPLDWIDGWPQVRGGWGASDSTWPAPAAQPGDTLRHTPCPRPPDEPGAPLDAYSDEFAGSVLDPRWSWVRPPPPERWSLGEGSLRLDTYGELHGSSDSASVLLEDAPPGEWLVETRMYLDVPADGCCHDYAQAGLVIYRDDDNYIKLVHASIGESRQTEFGKEIDPVPAGYPFFGGSRAGPPGPWTWLRVVRRATAGGAARYTAHSSLDGATWTRGATWVHALGPGERIGLLAQNQAGWSAWFDYVRVSLLAADGDPDAADVDAVDSDGDGLADACTPDDDADGLPDVLDCARRDAAGGTPGEVGPLRISGGESTLLDWDRPPFADRFDVVRSSLAALGAGAYGPCLADQFEATSFEDADIPAAGAGFGYLVRGVNLACALPGTWGADSTGAPRVNHDPATCP
ncbi:MAG: family 43 glycosylhydrolase [Acidobacteria bacterium]|nr:family 43 glycosylhydrolase [Acidobacteriota bacterium]